MGIFSKFFGALKKTKDAISKKLSQIFVGELDDDFFEELEFVLVSSDISYEASSEIVESVRTIAKKQKIKTKNILMVFLNFFFANKTNWIVENVNKDEWIH